MNVVVPLFACKRCGEPGKTVGLQHAGTTVAVLHACHGCIDQTAAELARVRPVFDAMLAAGVARDLANDVMTFLLERLYPDPRVVPP